MILQKTERASQGNPLFEANPGGAPCNVLAMLAKLGHDTAFIGKVGNDFFGEQLRAAIKEVGIDDTGLCTDEKIHTTLAMVHTYPDGDRDFSFYRNPGAARRNAPMLAAIPRQIVETSHLIYCMVS